MSVKRALKLDSVKKDNPYDVSPLKFRKKKINSFSPTTGTRQMSPFSSPTSHEQDLQICPSNGDGTKQNNSKSKLSRRGQPQTKEFALMELQSTVKSSLDTILKIRARLTSLKALEGSRELGTVLGVSNSAAVLHAELQKTDMLMSQAEGLQLFKRNRGKLPAGGYFQTASSSAFLKLLID